MYAWEWEDLEGAINDKLFEVIDAGPLYGPVHAFSLRRDDQLRLILETQSSGSATASIAQPPSGTVYLNTHTVELAGCNGLSNFKAVMHGVQPAKLTKNYNTKINSSELHQTAQVHWVEMNFGDSREVHFTIDWLENVSPSPFVWPHSFEDASKETKTRTLSGACDDLIVTGTTEIGSTSRRCVGFKIDGVQIYLCALSKKGLEGPRRPGCMIYRGKPDNAFREKIRLSASFVLGMYLVHLGSTFFDEDSSPVSLRAISGYSLDMRAFNLFVLPPAPLGSRYKFEIDPASFTKAVQGICDSYDVLQFRSLSWQYWHACCATMHIAGAHFGAAIEALLRSYTDAHQERFESTFISDRAGWKAFTKPILEAISALSISDTAKQGLKNKVGSLNQRPVKMLMVQLLAEMDLKIGGDELRAWERRNMAAHGHHLEDGEELQIVRDTNLLQGLFHRMLLRITGACSRYYDFCSPDTPVRNLSDCVPDVRHPVNEGPQNSV